MNPEMQSIMDQVDVDLSGYDQPDAEETRYFALDGTDITEEVNRWQRRIKSGRNLPSASRKPFPKGSFHGTAVGVRPGLKMPFPVHATMA